MARIVRDARLETRAARNRLKPMAKPYWRTIRPKALHLGYRRRRKGEPGQWIARAYIGLDEQGVGRYREAALGLADDYGDADGEALLSFAQAQTIAQEKTGAARRKGQAPPTVAEVVAAYVEALDRGGRPTGDARSRINQHIIPALGALKVEELTTERLQRWLADLAAAPAQGKRAPTNPEEVRRRRSTANRTLTVLKAALNAAFDAQRVKSIDAWGRRLKPFRSVDAARIQYLSVADAQRLINAADRESGFRNLVQAALLTGARYGELARLTVADFNPDAGTVTIRQAKSGRPRHAFLTDEGAAFFSSMCAGRLGDMPLLTCRVARRRRSERSDAWHPSDQIRPMAEAVKRARISPPISFHGLRHTYASLAIMNGVPLQVIARNLGHADTRMVERHYGHLDDSYVRSAIREGAPRFNAVEPTTVEPLKRRRQ